MVHYFAVIGYKLTHLTLERERVNINAWNGLFSHLFIYLFMFIKFYFYLFAILCDLNSFSCETERCCGFLEYQQLSKKNIAFYPKHKNMFKSFKEVW